MTRLFTQSVRKGVATMGPDLPSGEAATARAVVDESGVLVDWNEGARRLLGYAPEEVEGRPVADLLVLGGAGPPPRLSGDRWSGTVELRHRDGRTLSVWLLAHHRQRAPANGAGDWLLVTPLGGLVVRLSAEAGQDGTTGEVGATCLYAVYDPISRRCTLARAGHPPPVMMTPGARPRQIKLPAGPPLGLGGLPFESAVVDLPEGTVLGLYTDGLIESRERDVDASHRLLCDALAGSGGSSLNESCDRILHALLPACGVADDVALLLARTYGLPASQVTTWDIPADPALVAAIRKQVVGQLDGWHLSEAAFTVELVVSELVTNAIRYGDHPIRLRLIHDAATLICEVFDASHTAPHLRRARTFDEGGRGLLLVAQLTQRWGSRHTPDGKTIWAEISLTDE